MAAGAWTDLRYQQNRVLPEWLVNQLFSQNQHEWKHETFTRRLRALKPPGSSSGVRLVYLNALRQHGYCHSCLEVDKNHGLTFCAELENKLVEAHTKVSHSLYFSRIEN
jgi:hypothetical protein